MPGGQLTELHMADESSMPRHRHLTVLGEYLAVVTHTMLWAREPLTVQGALNASGCQHELYFPVSRVNVPATIVMIIPKDVCSTGGVVAVNYLTAALCQGRD